MPRAAWLLVAAGLTVAVPALAETPDTLQTELSRLVHSSTAGRALRPLDAVLLPWLALLIAGLPRDLRAWAFGGLALVLRGALAPFVSSLPTPKGWWLDASTAFLDDGFSWTMGAYGDGWDAVMGLARAVLPWADTPQRVLLAGSALTVVLVHAAVRHATRDTRSADLAAVILATLPLHIVYAAALSRFGLGAIVGTVAALALVRDAPRDRWLAALSLGLLVQCRPTLLFVAGVGVLVLLWRARGPGALAVALVGARVAQLFLIVGEEGASGGMFDQVLLGLDQPHVGPGARFVLLDPTQTPAAVPVLAAAGIVALPWRARLPALAALAMLTLPYRHFGIPFDLVRMQAPSFVLGAALAGIGAGALWRRVGARVALPVLAVAALTWWPARHAPAWPRWAWWPEEAILRAGVARLPDDAPVVIDVDLDARNIARWLWTRGHPRVFALGAPDIPADAWRFVGLSDHLRTGGKPELAGWTPVVETVVPENLGTWWEPTGHPVRLGWYVREDAP